MDRSMRHPSYSTILHLPKYFALILGTTAAVLYGILGTMAILRLTAPLAGLALFILPFKAVIVLLVFAFVGFWVGVFVQGLLDHYYRYTFRFFLAIIIIVAILFFSMTLGSELFSTYREITRISSMNTQELEQAYLNRPKHSLYGYDIYILAAIAQNPNTSSTLLDKIAHLNESRINERIGSLFNLTRENKRGFAVVRLIEQNPNVSTKTLVYLTDSNNFYLLGDLSTNPKLPKELLRKLYTRAQASHEGYLIDWGLAENSNTPPDILRALAKKIQYDRGFDPINSALKNNPSTPEDVKKGLRL